MSTTTAGDSRDQRMEEAGTPRQAQIAHVARPRRSTVAVALAGLAVAVLAASTLLSSLSGNHVAVVGGQPERAAVTRLSEVTTADLVYEPGHSSGWHVHSGVHSVVVLSGMLTVFDEACARHDYGPGQTYLGGREPHLARNFGAEAAGFVVTYVAESSAESPGHPVAAPTGCETT